jgi:hypothetical protein
MFDLPGGHRLCVESHIDMQFRVGVIQEGDDVRFVVFYAGRRPPDLTEDN